MFLRKLQREMACVAIAACAPLVFGCATTRNYLVDPENASRETVLSVTTQRGRTVEFEQPPPTGLVTEFDGPGGAIDITTMTARGAIRGGEAAAVPLASAGEMRLLAGPDGREVVEAYADALVAGRGWLPDGEVQTIVLRSGEVLDARASVAAVDAQHGVLLLAPARQDTTAIPFGDIRYLRIRDDHPGRTFLAILGVVGLGIAVAFVASVPSFAGD